MLKKLKDKLRCRRGEGYVDVVVLVLCAMLVLALAIRVLPVFIAKQQLDTFATELVREAEISGRVGLETSRRAAVLREKAEADIVSEKKKAVNEIKDEISDIAILIAEKVVEKEITPADHEKLIAQFIDRVGE